MNDKNLQNDDANLVFDEDESSADSLKKMRSKVKVLTEENKELLLGWQRARADFANLQRESGENYKKAKILALNDFLEDFIPVLDSFDMAFSNKEALAGVSENWLRGVEYIRTQALSALEKNGVTSFGKVGEDFDPKIHHSNGLLETENEGEDGKVVAVDQSGYRIGDHVLRPAGVKVASYKQK